MTYLFIDPDYYSAALKRTSNMKFNFPSDVRSMDTHNVSYSEDILSIKDGIATIKIHGPIFASADPFDLLFFPDLCLHSDILKAISSVKQNEGIKAVVFEFNSPGGGADGLLNLMRAVQSIEKNKIAVCGGLCTSAAFFLASQCDRVIARDECSLIGSVGVADISHVDSSRISITNRLSKDKMPDVSTDDGVSVVQDRLDELYNIFLKEVAKGRSVAIALASEQFGSGRVFVAEKALERGMIDSIGDIPFLKTDNTAKGYDMNREELESQHPHLLNLIRQESKAQGFEEGKHQERERVLAHLTYANGTELMAKALEYVRDGVSITPSIQSAYDVARTEKTLKDQYNASQIQQSEDQPIQAHVPSNTGMSAAEEKYYRGFLGDKRFQEICDSR